MIGIKGTGTAYVSRGNAYYYTQPLAEKDGFTAANSMAYLHDVTEGSRSITIRYRYRDEARIHTYVDYTVSFDASINDYRVVRR